MDSPLEIIFDYNNEGAVLALDSRIEVLVPSHLTRRHVSRSRPVHLLAYHAFIVVALAFVLAAL